MAAGETLSDRVQCIVREDVPQSFKNKVSIPWMGVLVAAEWLGHTGKLEDKWNENLGSCFVRRICVKTLDQNELF
jgi:hypothetical protein